ncbi:hypothetical protein [Methylobacterium sp. B4]|uniref:hypothetical protein n=1 Tax=Methylobacterium sp. B4 TaxID=1938755 RepID=UPI000D7697B2|nr:hypothetical protein [Methylobacterium sp. B4]PXW66701.1 hypothetical protein BY998_101261 [Methylobacterium sp. B4]
MRAASLALLALALPDPAFAEPRPQPEGGADRPNLGRGAPHLQRESDDSAARQADFDRRIAQRSNRAARSICAGCGAGSGGRGAGVTPSLRSPGRDEPRPGNPAEAPLD